RPVRRRKRPGFVIRGSFSTTPNGSSVSCGASSSAFCTIVRNLSIRKGTPSLPARSWARIAGRPPSIRIQRANAARSGESRTSRTAAAIRSAIHLTALTALPPQPRRIDRSFQTDARARPARPGRDTASGVSPAHLAVELVVGLRGLLPGELLRGLLGPCVGCLERCRLEQTRRGLCERFRIAGRHDLTRAVLAHDFAEG